MIEICAHSQLYIADKLKAINDVITGVRMWYEVRMTVQSCPTNCV